MRHPRCTRPFSRCWCSPPAGPGHRPPRRPALAVALDFTVAPGGSADAFWFDAASPHLLLKVQPPAHRTLLLERSARVPCPRRDSTAAQP